MCYCAVLVVPNIALAFSCCLCSHAYVHSDSKQFASSNLRVGLALAANVVFSGRVVP